MKSTRCKHCKKEFRKQYTKQQFCASKCANRHNLNGLNKIKLPRPSLKLAEFIGIVMGDGYASKYYTTISLNSIADAKYIPYVQKMSSALFPGAPISILPRKGKNMTCIQISSSIVANYLRQMGMIPHKKTIPQWILAKSLYRKALMKGLFDTEGSISFKIYRSRAGISVYKQLNFRNADQKLMRFVRDELAALGLKPTKTLRRSLYLSNHSAIDTYRNEVGFGNHKLLQRSKISDYTAYSRWRGV